MSTPSSHPARRFILLSVVVLLAIIAFVVFRPRKEAPQVVTTDSTEVYFPQPKKEVIPQPLETITLADSTTVWKLHKDAFMKPVKGFPAIRTAAVDGDLFVEVSDTSRPLVLKSRLLIMTVLGKARFRIIAWAKEAGEEVQVISGNIRVEPNYKSQFNEPDTLRGPQMVMINKDIDMMEKEKFDATELAAWSKGLVK